MVNSLEEKWPAGSQSVDTIWYCLQQHIRRKGEVIAKQVLQALPWHTLPEPHVTHQQRHGNPVISMLKGAPASPEQAHGNEFTPRGKSPRGGFGDGNCSLLHMQAGTTRLPWLLVRSSHPWNRKLHQAPDTLPCNSVTECSCFNRISCRQARNGRILCCWHVCWAHLPCKVLLVLPSALRISKAQAENRLALSWQSKGAPWALIPSHKPILSYRNTTLVFKSSPSTFLQGDVKKVQRKWN